MLLLLTKYNMGEGGGYKIIMSIKSNNLPINANNIVKKKPCPGDTSHYIFFLVSTFKTINLSMYYRPIGIIY